MLLNLTQWAFALLFPFKLYLLKDLLSTKPFFFAAVFAVFILILSILLIFQFWKDGWKYINLKLMHFSFFWFVITLAPIIGGNAHRWYLYIPSISVSLFVVSILRYSTDKKRNIFLVSFIIIVLGAYSIEAVQQTEIWSDQSKVNQSFLQQIKDNDLHKIDIFYFANVPFGYKSAFLFTFRSLEDAIYYHYGCKPKILILSYINLTNDQQIEASIDTRRISFSLNPNHYGFFIFPPLIRTFVAGNTKMKIHGLEISIGKIDTVGKAFQYTIILPENSNIPFYFFDGNRINRISKVN